MAPLLPPCRQEIKQVAEGVKKPEPPKPDAPKP